MSTFFRTTHQVYHLNVSTFFRTTQTTHTCGTKGLFFCPMRGQGKNVALSPVFSTACMSTHGAWTRCGQAWTRGRVGYAAGETFFKKLARHRDKPALSGLLPIGCVSRPGCGTRARQDRENSAWLVLVDWTAGVSPATAAGVSRSAVLHCH